MAFDRKKWNPIGGQSKKNTAPQMFSYSTTDAVGDVNTEGYFNSISQDVVVGDYIFVNASTGGTMTSTIHVVKSNASNVEDVSDGTTISQTDSD